MFRRLCFLSALTGFSLAACSSSPGDGSGGGGAPASGGTAPGSGGAPVGSGGAASGGGASGGAGNGGASSTGGAGNGSGGNPAGGAASGGVSGGSGGGQLGGGGDVGPTGGSAGSGGSVATGGGSASGGNASGGGATDCSTLPACDDFESDTAGMAPAHTAWMLEYGWNPVLEAGEEQNIQVASGDAHSPAQAVQVSSGSSAAPHSIAVAAPGETFYARAWLKVTLNSGNAVLMAVGPDHNDEIRLRLHEGKVTLNSAISDGLAPDPFTCTDCVDSIIGSWFCVELFYDGPSQTARLWIDEALAAEVVGNVGWHSGGEDSPDFPAAATKVWFGVLGLNGGNPSALIDDVAVGPARLGCD